MGVDEVSGLNAQGDLTAPVNNELVETDTANVGALGQSLDVGTNNLDRVGGLRLRDLSDRVIYGAGSGVFIQRSYGEDATITKHWSPPESQGGKESTLALVVGDDDDYVYDVYNNTLYSSGTTRGGQWGLSLKQQGRSTPAPFVIDFDNSALGGNSYQERVVLTPQGELALKNGAINIGSNPIKGLREVGTQPAASDLSSQEWAFTADRDGNSTPAWLYKDSGGTVHYWDSDGTL